MLQNGAMMTTRNTVILLTIYIENLTIYITKYALEFTKKAGREKIIEIDIDKGITKLLQKPEEFEEEFDKVVKRKFKGSIVDVFY